MAEKNKAGPESLVSPAGRKEGPRREALARKKEDLPSAPLAFWKAVRLAFSGSVGSEGNVGFLTIAQSASAKGTVGLAVLFGFQLRVFYRQVLANRDTLQECSRAAPRTNAPTS